MFSFSYLLGKKANMPEISKRLELQPVCTRFRFSICTSWLLPSVLCWVSYLQKTREHAQKMKHFQEIGSLSDEILAQGPYF